MRIAVVYYSMYGHIARMAEEVAEGAREKGATVEIYQIPETLSDEVLTKMGAPPKSDHPIFPRDESIAEFDGFLFGIPTRFGALPAQWKAWWDSTGGLWSKGTLIGKPAGIFVSTGTLGGGQETTALTAIPNLAHHGMVFVPIGYSNPLLQNLEEQHGGSPYGAGTLAGPKGERQPSELELKIARHQGSHFTEIAAKMTGHHVDQSMLQPFIDRAQYAESKLEKLKWAVTALEKRLGLSPSFLTLGEPSTMSDDYQLNIRKMISRAAKVQPHSLIVTKTMDGYSEMTYSELVIKSTKLASALHKNGVIPGDRIATFMWNNGRHMQLYYAVPSLGAILHTLNLRLHPSELAYIIGHAKDKLIFVDYNLLPLLKMLPSEVWSNVEKIVVCGKDEKPGGYKIDMDKVVDFDEFVSEGDDYFDWPELDERSGMALCYTSGTTGKPKGVLYSHRSMSLHTLNLLATDQLNASGTDVILPYVPMFHAVAWTLPYAAMVLGFKLVLYNCYRTPELIAQQILDQKVTVFAGVPTVMSGLQDQFSKDPDKFAPIKGVCTRALVGGSAVPRSTVEFFWDEYGIEVIHGYGMTETNPLCSLSRRECRFQDLDKNDEEKIENLLSQGVMTTLVESRLANPDNLDEEVPHDGQSIGELLVRGPWITQSYFHIDAPDKFHKGWLRTGDISSLSNVDEMVIRDRSKDLIKSGGEWISSVDVENHVLGMDGVKTACCVGVSHSKWAERPIVILVMDPDFEGEPPSLEQINEHCLTKFSKFQCPDDVLYWEEIPLTGTGKLSKKDVRQKLTDEHYVLPSEKPSASADSS